MALNFSINKMRIISIIICILLISCETEEEIKYNIFKYEKKLIVQGYISSDSKIVVKVGKSLPPLTNFTDTIDISVKEVRIKVIANDIPLFLLQEQGTGYFVSPDTFIANKHTKYQLEVTAEGFPSVISEPVYLPIMPQIDSVSILTINELDNIQLKFYDYDINKNYYYFQRYIYHNGNKEIEDFFNGEKSSDPIFYSSKIIYDNMFNGKNYEIRDLFPTFFTYNDDTVKADSIKVTLYTLSDELVKYLESLNEWDLTKDDMWQEIPVQIFSNIRGGYGIFYSFSRKSVTLKI